MIAAAIILCALPVVAAVRLVLVARGLRHGS